MGLVEKEWLDTLAAVDPAHVTYTDYVECGRLRNFYHFFYRNFYHQHWSKFTKSLIQILFFVVLHCPSRS